MDLSLVDRANDWLLKATDSKILTCETLQWTSTKAHQLDDSEQMMMSRAASDGSNTYYKRGLRLWLTPRTTNSRQPQVLAYTDYAPETNDVLTNVINRANKAATTDGIEGKIITIETVQAPILNGNVDSTGLWWSEKASEDYPWAMVLRTFYIKDTRTKETIGIKDFVPQQSSDGFEPFSQLIEKANKWLKDQSDIRVTNMQSIILPKRDTPLSEISSVCFIVVPGVHSSTKQEYLRILRVTYTNPAEDALSELPLVYPFYFETFTPEIVTPKDNKKKERIERMKETFSRVATFLKNTELDVICVEVVPNPIHIPEVDSLNADDDKQQMRFLCTLRLYLNGQVNIDNVARSLLAAVSTSHVQPTHPSGNAAAAAATQQSPLLPHQQSIQQSHYHVPIPNAGHTNNSKFIASKSIRDKSRTRIDSLDTSHPGPIFLRHVTVGPRRNRMIIAFITVFVAISIIVVLSVFYTNQLDT